MKQLATPEVTSAAAVPFHVSWESLLETANGSSPTANGSSPTANGSSPTVNSPEDFLRSLERPNHRGYKRYVGSPIRYAGGKSLAVGHIIQQLPRHLTRLVSPFLGGGSLETACAKELGMEVKAYDVFDILTCYWQMQLQKPVALFRRLSCWQPTLECYQQVKARLKAHWLKQRRLPPEDLAAHYYFNYNLSYGPGFLGWMSKIYNCPKRYQKLLQRVRDFSAGRFRVECAGFEESIPAHEGDFLYCDPPYYLGEDSKMFRGIYPQRNFPVHHNGFDHALKLRQTVLLVSGLSHRRSSMAVYPGSGGNPHR